MMKLFSLALAAFGTTFALPATASDVTVTITGVKAKGGTMLVALYDEATFFKARPPHTTSVKVTAAGELTVTLRDVPPGDYAVTALHDADDNKSMTMGPDGRFAEGTALSNAEALRGPPSFSANKVAVPASGLTISLAMSYPEDRSGW